MQVINLDGAQIDGPVQLEVYASTYCRGKGVSCANGASTLAAAGGAGSLRRRELRVSAVDDPEERVNEGNCTRNVRNVDLRPEQRGGLLFFDSSQRAVLLAHIRDPTKPEKALAFEGGVPAVQVEAGAGKAGATGRRARMGTGVMSSAQVRVTAKNRQGALSGGPCRQAGRQDGRADQFAQKVNLLKRVLKLGVRQRKGRSLFVSTPGLGESCVRGGEIKP